MYPKHHFLRLLLVFASFSLSFCTYQNDPFPLHHRRPYHPTNYGGNYYYNPGRAYRRPTFFPGRDTGNYYRPESPSLLSSRSNSFGMINSARRAGSPSNSQPIFNVDDFGARGDGRDDSEAFNKAWNRACSSKQGAILVPKNKVYHLKPITFSGPCQSDLTMLIYGTIKASPRRSDYENDRLHWIKFQDVENLRVEGGGTINGNGKIWWRNSCKINKALPCKHAPTAVTFHQCNNLRVANLRFKNAQQMHLTFQKCLNVLALNLRVIAPGNSPNTDGIHVTDTQNIQIMNSLIRTGDDCISIVNGSKNVRATDITCGPGHGISIGSLGADNSEGYVSNVFVNRARLTGTTNGVRIKTWQGGRGYAKNIKFQNIVMNNVTNPILIDQNYSVQVSNVIYNNIKGTSASEVAMKFDCSKNYPCGAISLRNIHLVPLGYQRVEASCENVRLDSEGIISPTCSSL
ncbi:hypothetical protein UlMin_007356 [Ulmus minor]